MSLADQQWCPTTVQVTVLQARGLRIKGKSGTNDAYAVMQVGKEKYQTSVVEKSVAPVWKEEAAFDLPPPHQGGGGGGGERGTLHVHVLHRALVGPDKQLGQAVINLMHLSEDTTRNKTEWFKLLDKTGKADKDRGEVLLDIQFMRNNMTASMFDLSAAGKSRSRLGKFKDKVRGKKKESDTVSGVVPSFTQVLTDSEEEEAADGDGEVAAGKDEKKKKNKMKSLFSPKSNLQKSMSQSMSVLPAKNSSLSGSQSSGLNVDPSEGKKKFKFLKHKRSGSSDSKNSSSKHAAVEQTNLCINGSHVYCEEPQPRTSRIGSNFSLASSGHGSMEDVPESSPPSVDSLRAVRQYSPWTEEEEETENITEDLDELRKEEEERIRMEEERKSKEEEEERARRQEEALERLAEEKRRREEEERKRIEEEEEVRREEEERMRRDEERRRQEEEERVRREQERRRQEEEERVRREQERRRQEEEERVRREEEERKLVEEKRRLEEERRIEEERVKKEEEERIRREEERKRREEEERERLEEEERRRIEEEEKRQREEEEKLRRQAEEERKLAEERRRVEEERRRIEEEERIRREEERAEEERRSREEERRAEEERRRREEERAEEERRRREEERAEEERRRKEQEEECEEKRRLEEHKKRQREEEERIRKEEEERARKEKEEYERLVEEKRKLEEQERERIEAEEKIRREEEERIRVEEEQRRKELEAERVRKEEEEREEKRKLQEQERRRTEEEERRQREEKERIMQEEEERARKEKEEYERLVEEKRRLEEQERRQKEEEERIREEEQERVRMEKERRRRQEEEERAKKEKEEMERLAEEKRRLEEQEKRRIEEEEKIKREEEERIRKAEKAERERKEEEARKMEEEKITRDAEEQKRRENETKDGHKAGWQKSKLAVESPAEVTSTNPFDENFSNNPFDEIPDSAAGHDGSTATVSNIQQGYQSAVSSVGSKTVSTGERDLISAQREKRPAPQPPGRSQAESQREQDVSTQHLAQTNKQSNDKDVKTASVLPQRSVQMIAPLSQPLTDSKDTQGLMQSSTTKATASAAKHGKRPAPLRPRSVEEEPPSEPKTTSACSETKQVPVVYGLNPFEDDECEEDDTTTLSHAADRDAVAQEKLKSSKVARAPPPPAKKAAESSILIAQNSDGGHVTDDTGVAVPDGGANQARDQQPAATISVTSQKEAQPARAQSTAEEAGVKKEAPPATSRRLQPVKPLNPLEQQSASIVQGGMVNKSTGILCEVQEKAKVNDTGVKGPYSQLTREELISLVLKQEKQLSERDTKISEMEQYIDNLLVRIIEEKPSILMSMGSLKKAA